MLIFFFVIFIFFSGGRFIYKMSFWLTLFSQNSLDDQVGKTKVGSFWLF